LCVIRIRLLIVGSGRGEADEKVHAAREREINHVAMPGHGDRGQQDGGSNEGAFRGQHWSSDKYYAPHNGDAERTPAGSASRWSWSNSEE
jgi:hypothetical protein